MVFSDVPAPALSQKLSQAEPKKAGPGFWTQKLSTLCNNFSLIFDNFIGVLIKINHDKYGYS